MADGSHVAIEQIKVGDLVMSRDTITGATSVQKVTQTFERQADATLVLRLKNGETIETTKEHPFYVESQGFTPAGEMGIGTSIVTRAGPSAILASSQVRNQKATVYNFEVEKTHTYFVGHSDLWVHNVCKLRWDPIKKIYVSVETGAEVTRPQIIASLFGKPGFAGKIPILLDENLSYKIAIKLRELGYDVWSAQRLYDATGVIDPHIIEDMTRLGGKVITKNHGDFPESLLIKAPRANGLSVDDIVNAVEPLLPR